MKNRNVVNLLRIASSIEASNPVLSRELERLALSVINPGAKKFEDHVGDVVEILKDLKAELEKADKQLDTDDAKEFANFFEDEAKAQTEDLRQMLKVGAYILRMADDTAGVMDKVKGFFKKKDKTADPDTKANEPSYQMDESEMDEFVDGKRDWSEPSQKIEKETKENKEFFEDAKNVQQLLDKVRDKPSRSMVKTIISDLGDLIERGTALMKGKRKVEKVPQADDVVKSNAEDAKDLVAKYAPMLEGASGADLMKALKDFFAEASPLLEAPRAAVGSRRELLPLLVRTASANPSLRPVLLPVIKRWTGKTASRRTANDEQTVIHKYVSNVDGMNSKKGWADYIVILPDGTGHVTYKHDRGFEKGIKLPDAAKFNSDWEKDAQGVMTHSTVDPSSSEGKKALEYAP